MLFHLFRWLFTAPPRAQAVEVLPPSVGRASSFFTSDMEEIPRGNDRRALVLQAVKDRALTVTPAQFRIAREGVGMDSMGDLATSAKGAFSLSDSGVPDAQLLWYASQGFIGFQLCAILAQHWLVQKACEVPAKDAIRNGYRVTVNGDDVAPEVVDKIRAADKRHGVKRQLVELVKMSRVFGIRVAMFKVESTDPQYYERPFNPDGITPGSYKGIVQIDPYWCIPELSMAGASDPASADFYEPTYWTIQGRRYHKSHLVIVRGPEVPDLLKPSYQYAGLSLVQRIYERVYAAERTANEGPQLALSKRAMIFYTDTGKALANQGEFEERLSLWARFRDNFGVKVADKEGDKIEQHDTALGDFDQTVMTQYQLVAAIADVPATKLLGTSPKGFNATGEHELKSYHGTLETIQTTDMEPLLNRHHMCVIRSEIAPSMRIAPFSVTVEWEPTDSPGAKEEAEIRKINAETDKVYVDAGALDGTDIRNRIAADPKSGYDGLPALPADEVVDPLPTGGAPVAMDSADWDPVTGTYAEAELITNQTFLSHERVAEKIAHHDYTVQLSPEFVTSAGKRYRVIIDGHHSLQAAVESGNLPVFVEANYGGSDYRNALTQLPLGGTEATV